MSIAHLNTSAANEDELAEVVAAIDELVSEVGIAAVLRAFLHSRAGEAVGKLGDGNATLRAAQFILRQIAYSDDPQLEAEIMALGSGIILSDKITMERLAKKHGVTRAAISKRAVKFCEENGLPPSTYMRSEKDRKTYALTNQPRAT